MGQQLTHVDHSQDTPFDAAGFLDALLDDDVHDDAGAALHWNYRDDFEAIIALWGRNPLGEASIGRMRCYGRL